MNLNNINVGYWPYTKSLNSPGDRRRFVFFANETNIKYELADTAKFYDIVYLTSSCNISEWLKYKKTHPNSKIIFELIDSYTLQKGISNIGRGILKYIKGKNSKLFLNYKRAFINIIKISDAVVCSTSVQKINLLKFNKNVHISLDYFSNDITSYKIDYAINNKLKLVWEGQSYTVKNLLKINKVLEKLKHEIELHVITDSVIKHPINIFSKPTINILKKLKCKWFFHEWNLNSFSDLITSCDIAIIPINNSKIMQNKPENKLLLFWELGIPVVTSSTPAYERVMNQSNINFHCSNKNEWFNKLNDYLKLEIDEKIKLNKIVQEYLQKNHTKDLIIKNWKRIFESILNT
jgi:hypothetical protein